MDIRIQNNYQIKNEVNKTVSAEEVVEILERVRVKGDIELI